MDLQYQLSNGRWISCDYGGSDRTEEFIGYAAAYKKMTRDEIVKSLLAGKEVQHGSDWYSSIRIKPAPAAPPAGDARPVLRCKSCRQTGHAGSYPFSTLPESGLCDDCVA